MTLTDKITALLAADPACNGRVKRKRPELSDREREARARQFFWSIMDQWGQIPDVATAQRQIMKIAEALPPFTAIERGDFGAGEG